jgi:hypothetical protein
VFGAPACLISPRHDLVYRHLHGVPSINRLMPCRHATACSTSLQCVPDHFCWCKYQHMLPDKQPQQWRLRGMSRVTHWNSAGVCQSVARKQCDTDLTAAMREACRPSGCSSSFSSSPAAHRDTSQGGRYAS